MDGGEHHPARLIELVGVVLRRFQRQIRHELFEIGVGRGDVREFREALLAAGPVVGEYGLETRRVVLDAKTSGSFRKASGRNSHVSS